MTTSSTWKQADFSRGFVPGAGAVCARGIPVEVLEARRLAGKADFAETGSIVIQAIHEASRHTRYIDKTRSLSDEKAVIEIAQTENGATVTIRYAHHRGLFYALLRVDRLLQEGFLPQGEAEDYPLFGVRGYIEGFYGQPWSFEQKKGMLAFAAAQRMNTHYYAPKDDPYHRDLWRELYPHEELSRLAELACLSKSLFIDFHYCIAPGLNIRYSDPAEFDALMVKISQIYSAGVSHFGLLLDDIGEELSFEEDRAAFGETVNAHSDLACRFYDALKSLDSGIVLTVCPMQYFGRGDEYYISALGRSLPPEVRLFWTGRDICSRELTSPQAVSFAQHTMHRPMYWDNYPVNDAEMYNEMHLGPLIGRDPDLFRYADGLIANCMEYCECSKIPLITIADYLWDSEGYDPEASWARALEQVAGKEDAAVFGVFADHLRTSCLMDSNSPAMQKVFASVAQAFRNGDIAAALAGVSAYIEATSLCAQWLKKDSALSRELTKWSEKFFILSDIVAKLPETALSGEKSDVDELLALIDAYESKPTVLTKFNIRQELGGFLHLS